MKTLFLTPDQKNILLWRAIGWSRYQIAARLKCSPYTIDDYLEPVYIQLKEMTDIYPMNPTIALAVAVALRKITARDIIAAFLSINIIL